MNVAEKKIEDREYELDDVPKVNKSLHLQEMDTSSQQKKYLVEAGAGNSLQVNEKLYQVISLIDGEKTVREIAQAYASCMDKEIESSELLKVINRILVPRKMILSPHRNGETTQTKEKATETKRKKASFLLVQLPLLDGNVINYITDRLRVLFTPTVAWPVIFLSFGMHALLYSVYLEPMMINLDLLTPLNLIIVYAIGNATNIFHELGHASAMKYYRLPHGPLGVGLYLIFPVLYTDVRKIWRLERKQRIVVNLGGYYFEQFSMIFVGTLFLYTRDPIYLFMLFFMDLKLLFGLNPAFRFDGYYVLSDLIGVTNLKEKAKKLVGGLIQLNTQKITAMGQEYRPTVLGIVIAYTVFSYIFFGYFYYELIGMSIQFIPNLPDIITELYHAIGVKDYSFWIQNLKKLFINFSFSAIVFLLCFRVLKRGIRLYREV